MSNFLEDINVSDDLFNSMKEFYELSFMNDLYFNKELVSTNYNYLKSIGITCLDSILKYEASILLLDNEELVSLLDKDNKELIDDINNDFISIEKIFNS